MLVSALMEETAILRHSSALWARFCGPSASDSGETRKSGNGQKKGGSGLMCNLRQSPRRGWLSSDLAGHSRHKLCFAACLSEHKRSVIS